MNRLRKALPLVLLIASGVVLYVSGTLDRFDPQLLVTQHARTSAMVATHPWLSRLAYAGLLTLIVATGIPGSVLVTIAGGLLFGIWQGTAISSVATVLGSLLLFLASRFALGTGSVRSAPALVEHLRHGYAAHPANYTLFLRLVPGLPWGGVTVALAWLRCKLRLFLVATSIGSVAMLTIESAIGAGIGKRLDRVGADLTIRALVLDPRVLVPLAALALLALLPLWLHRRHHAPPTPGDQQAATRAKADDSCTGDATDKPA